MIDIRDINGKIRFSTPINGGSKRKFLLMKEDYITLKFSLDQHVYFKIGDCVDDPRFGLFELCDLYKPAFNNSNGGYDYELRLDAYYWKWKNKIFKFTPETGGQEASWNLTASLNDQLGVFLRNLKALGYTYKGTNFEFTIDSTVENSAKLMSYDKTNLLDALNKLAETWNCEWWMENSVIRFGRCEYGDPVDFELGKNVESMTRSESQTPYATRIYAFGSTRNIPTGYRPADENVLLNGIVQKRLMLPVGTPYIDAYPDMKTVEAIENVVVFEEVYPHRVGTMSEVTPHENTDQVENEDGTTTEEKWNAYRFKDTGITFSEGYVLAGQELKIAFQSGKLNGMEFAVGFNPDKLNEKNSDGTWNPLAQVWEIVRNGDYGRNLPGDTLIPQSGDTYILSGFDTKMVSDVMIPEAEKELKEKALQYIAKSKIDPSTYDSKMMAGSMLHEDGTPRLFEVGDKVNLINATYFEAGNRVSRIIGLEYNLDFPWDSPVYTVGESASYSRLGDLESKIESLTYKGETYTGNGGSGVYLIGTNDSTPASNRNVLSALRSLAEFISKKKDDAVQGVITFMKGIKVGKFVPGWIGTGAAITVDVKTGKTRLEVDEVLARDRFETMEFRFNRIEVIDGEQWSTFAFGKIKSVDTENQIAYLDLVDGELMSCHVNDICRGIFHNLTAANAAGNKMDDCGFYTQAGFSTSYFTPIEILPDGTGFKYALRPGTTQHPCAQMKFAAYGNLTDPFRRMSRVTNTRHSIYLKDVSVWQIDPDLHYGAAYGDLTGITINGVEFNGYSSFQTNGYFKGHIEFLPDQLEELKGNDGYSVSLTSYDAVVAVDSQGNIDDSIYDIINVVEGQEKVVTGDREVITKRYKIHTAIQAFKGGKELTYDTTPGEGTYAASFIASGCECSLGGGVLTITKIAADKATVTIEVNCEGHASFVKVFTLTRVYGGINADWTTYVFKQSDEKPATPTGSNLMPEGWSDAPTAEGRWWMSKAVVNGITKLPANWSEPVQVTCEDGSDTDFKYAKNNSDTGAPAIAITNRYPEGWSDNPPALNTGEFLWMSKAKINPDNTLNGEWSAPVRISGEKGYTGDWTSYVFKEASSRPATPSGTNPLPSGWSDGPGATGKWWMSKASINGITGEAREWSTPIQVSGQDGNGMHYEYAVNTSQTVAPTSGWSTIVPGVSEGQYLWMRWGQVIPPATYPSSWEGVARVTGEKGDKGLDGINGSNGNDGLDIYWMGDYASAPYGSKNWVYRNTTDGKVYIHNGAQWTLMVADGHDGVNGATGRPGTDGSDGYSVYITYHDNPVNNIPLTPTGEGTTNGWHTKPSNACIWMSQKVSYSAYGGSWGAPIQLRGADGEDANMLDWVKDWNGTATIVNGKHVISPNAYFGTVSNEKLMTGVLIGDGVHEKGKAGIYGINNNELTFKLDANTGEAMFKGEVNATSGTFVGSVSVGDFIINGSNDANQGIYYNVNDNSQNKYGLVKIQPRIWSTVPRDTLLQRNNTDLNVLMYLSRARNNQSDRALYVNGISEFNGRVAISGINAVDTTVAPTKPALFVEGGIGFNGGIHCEPITINRNYTIGDFTGSTGEPIFNSYYVVTGNGIDVSLQYFHDYALSGTIMFLATGGTNNWSMSCPTGGINWRGKGSTQSIEVTGDYEIWIITKPKPYLITAGLLY